jgi:2-phosphoglycolate phosphatase
VIEAVLFDLDGTLIDSDAAIVWCVNELLSKHGLSAAPPNSIITLIGIGLTPLLAHFMDDPEKYVPEYRALYREGFSERTAVYPGAVELLRDLKKRGIKTAIVTNRNAELASDIIKAKGLWEYFDTLVGENGNISLKPEPAMIFEACRQLNVDPEKTLMVGDTDIDMQTGRSAGCRTAFFTRSRPTDENRADYIISALNELESFV